MSRVCDLCDKKAQRGRKITLIWGVKYRSIKRRQPNLRKVKLEVEGLPIHAKICAKCLKSVKQGKISGVRVPDYQKVPAEAKSEVK